MASTAVDLSAVARVLGIQTKFINTNVGGLVFLPMRVAVVGQGSDDAVYATDKVQVTSESEVAALFGRGSPLHLAAKQLLPQNGDGVRSVPVTIYPLAKSGTGAAAVGAITPTGTATKAGTFIISVNGESTAQVGVIAGDTVADVVAKFTTAVNAALDIPVVAADNASTDVTITSKWSGASSNALKIDVSGPTDTGITIAITQPTGGAANPDVQPALDQIGDVWETLVLNCLDADDDTALDTYETFAEGRWGALTRKPLVVVTGHDKLTPNDITPITDARRGQRTNILLPNPGSVNLPFVSAAGMLSRVAVSANNTPERDFGGLVASYIEPGADGAQWTYPQRDQAVKGGASTIEVKNSQVTISDVVTTYHPEGDQFPAYRYLKDIIVVMNAIFNVDLIFNTNDWNGAALIPDDQPTVSANARKPKNAVSALGVLARNLGLNALISDVPYTLANTSAEISSSNPNRLDIIFPIKVRGNSNIISVDLNFGFYFGAQTVIN